MASEFGARNGTLNAARGSREFDENARLTYTIDLFLNNGGSAGYNLFKPSLFPFLNQPVSVSAFVPSLDSIDFAGYQINDIYIGMRNLSVDHHGPFTTTSADALVSIFSSSVPEPKTLTLSLLGVTMGLLTKKVVDIIYWGKSWRAAVPEPNTIIVSLISLPCLGIFLLMRKEMYKK